MLIKDKTISIIIKLDDNTIFKNNLVSLRRSLESTNDLFNIIILSECKKYKKQLRTLLNTYESNNFNTTIIECNNFNNNSIIDFIDSDFIIEIDTNIFIIDDYWYNDLINYVKNYGIDLCAIESNIKMYKKELFNKLDLITNDKKYILKNNNKYVLI